MRKLLPRTRTVLLLAATVAVIAGVGVATGAIPGADGTITACYKAKGGAIRIVDGESGATPLCASDEVKLSWSQKGPVGPAGAKGDTGPAGTKGDKGDKGDTGPQGAAACDSSRLLLCPDADLPSGQTLALTIDGSEILRVSTYRINCTTTANSGCW